MARFEVSNELLAVRRIVLRAIGLSHKQTNEIVSFGLIVWIMLLPFGGVWTKWCAFTLYYESVQMQMGFTNLC